MLNTSILAAIVNPSQLLTAGPNRPPLNRGATVRVWTGKLGKFLGWTRDGWCRVRIEGERRVDEWQRWQLEVMP